MEKIRISVFIIASIIILGGIIGYFMCVTGFREEQYLGISGANWFSIVIMGFLIFRFFTDYTRKKREKKLQHVLPSKMQKRSKLILTFQIGVALLGLIGFAITLQLYILLQAIIILLLISILKKDSF